MHPLHLLCWLMPTALLAKQILLPKAPGPHSVTIRTSQLDDFFRQEIFSSTPTHRRMMISVFSPTRENVTGCQSLYMPPDVAAYATAAFAANPPPYNLTIDMSKFSLRACSIDVTYGTKKCEAAAVGKEKTSTAFPLIIFGPGLGGSRFVYNLIAQFLASYGYIVVTTDHPYDATGVQFPDNSYILASNQSADTPEHLERSFKVRTADVSFVVDQLSQNKTLRNLVLPRGTKISSFNNVGIWGHSFGGATAIQSLINDARFKAAINLDGTLFGNSSKVGSDRPAILWQADEKSANGQTDPTWIEVLPRLKGFKRHLELLGTAHLGISDIKYLADLVGTKTPILGSIDGLREINILTSYARDFFAHTIQGLGSSGLVEKASKKYPEVVFRKV